MCLALWSRLPCELEAPESGAALVRLCPECTSHGRAACWSSGTLEQGRVRGSGGSIEQHAWGRVHSLEREGASQTRCGHGTGHAQRCADESVRRPPAEAEKKVMKLFVEE